MQVGFTGTREGMTPNQRSQLWAWLARQGATEFHHGCCVGADGEAAAVAGESEGEKPPAAKGKNVEARMLKILADNPDSANWDSEQWASRLDCRSGTVRGTKTWRERIPILRTGKLLSRSEAKKLVDMAVNDAD